MTRQFANISIDITEDVIARSTRRDSSHCMIADAIKVGLPGVSYVAVDIQTIRFTDRQSRKRYIYLTPRVGQIELVNFDQGDKPEPFTLRLRNPQVIDLPERRPTRDAVADRPEAETPEAPKVGAKAKAPRKRGEVKGVATGKHEGGRAYKTGGEPPPAAALSNAKGRIREFGLRTLAR